MGRRTVRVIVVAGILGIGGVALAVFGNGGESNQQPPGPQADLRISQTVDNASPTPGTDVAFTVRVANKGPGRAGKVTVVEALPPGLQYAGHEGGVYDPGTGVWTVGDLDPGTEKTLTIHATVGDTEQTVTARVTADQADPNPADNSHSVTVTPEQPSAPSEAGPDLFITKRVDATSVDFGDRFDFIIEVWNESEVETATDVKVTDLLPAGLTYLDHGSGNSLDKPDYNPQTGVWKIGRLRPGENAEMRISVRADTFEKVVNQAEVTHAAADPTPGNNRATVEIDPTNVADLAIEKSVDNSTPNIDQEFTFTIKVTNKGPNPVNGIRIVDFGLAEDLDSAEVEVLGAEATHGYLDTETPPPAIGLGPREPRSTGVWKIPDTLRPGEAAVLKVKVVRRAGHGSGSFDNVARVDGSHLPDFEWVDPNPENNESKVTVEVSPAADLHLEKAVDDLDPSPGGTITFTLTVENKGPDTATGVVVYDPLGAGITYVSDDGGGAFDPASGVWTIGDLPVGESRVLKIVARAPGTVTTAANLARVDSSIHDHKPGNNEASVEITTFPVADLVVFKTAPDQAPVTGSVATFTISVRNRGPSDATGVQVTDQLPDGLTFQAARGPGTFDPDTGIWNLGSVPRGATVELEIDVLVDGTGLMRNTASVTASNQQDTDRSNNSDSTETLPRTRADLGITKTVDDPNPVAGQRVTFTLTVTNHGKEPARAVGVLEELPDGVTYVSHSGDGDFDPEKGGWSLSGVDDQALLADQIEPGGTRILRIVAEVTGDVDRITNSADVGTLYSIDENPANNKASVSIEVKPSADVEVKTTVDDPTPAPGQKVAVTVKVTNNGPDPATNTEVKGLKPGAYTYQSDTAGGAYDPGTGMWMPGDLGAGSSAEFTYTVEVDGTQQTTTAQVSADQTDPDPANNTDSATVTPALPTADLKITKTVDNPRPQLVKDLVFKEIEDITFTITVTNNGPAPASGVQVTDDLSSGFEYWSNDSGGTYNSLTGVWEIGQLAPGASRTLKIEAKPKSLAAATNSATVTSTGTTDTNPANNQASVTVTPRPITDLKITKEVDDPTPRRGDIVTFTIKVSNGGPADATNVEVADALPEGLEYLSHVDNFGNSGVYDPVSGIWTIRRVWDGEDGNTCRLRIVARVTTHEPVTNRAEITKSDQEDRPDPDNNEASVTITPTPKADLRVVKNVDEKTPLVGDEVTFSIFVLNDGPDAATNVTVNDVLPSGVEYLSHQGEGYDPQTGVWEVGDVPHPGGKQLEIKVLVNSNGQVTNTASITKSDQDDPDGSNNAGSVTLSVQAASADLRVTKTVDNANPEVGDLVAFTVTVHNDGPDDATGVQITDGIPPALGSAGHSTPTKGQYDQSSGLWTIPSLPAGESAVVIIDAEVKSSGSITNRASVTKSDQPDPDGSNNVAEATITVPAPKMADLSLTKTVDKATASIGEQVTFTITVTNKGPATATGVQVWDRPPYSGFEYVSDDSGGTYSYDGPAIWEVGTLEVGESKSLKITVKVRSLSARTNSATIAFVDQSDPTSGDTEASVTVGTNYGPPP